MPVAASPSFLLARDYGHLRAMAQQFGTVAADRRAGRDGKSEGYPVTILGGDHGDVPREEKGR